MKSYFFFYLFFFCTSLSPLLYPNSISSSSEPSIAPDKEIIHPFPNDQHENLPPIFNGEKEEMPSWGTEHMERETGAFQRKFLNMLFLLGLLVGFMFLASWALKRMMKSKVNQLNTSGHIKVLESRYLSPRATLYMVEVQNQTFLIAETNHTVSPIATFPLEEKE